MGLVEVVEDVDVLVSLLEKHNPTAAELSTATLEAIFTDLEADRLPRTTAQVKAARKMGETRVAVGLEAALQRNRDYEAIWKDEESIRKYFGRA